MHKLPVVMAAVACMLCMAVTAALLQTAGGNASTEIPIMCSRDHLQQSKVDYVQRDLQATSETTVLSLLTLEVATFAISSSGSTGVPDRRS